MTSERSLHDALAGPELAVRQAYGTYRDSGRPSTNPTPTEFEEAELASIVGFLGSPAGRRYLDTCWRLDACIATNTEGLVEKIAAEATAILRGEGG